MINPKLSLSFIDSQYMKYLFQWCKFSKWYRFLIVANKPHEDKAVFILLVSPQSLTHCLLCAKYSSTFFENHQ